jgi:hypothetical protein
LEKRQTGDGVSETVRGFRFPAGWQMDSRILIVKMINSRMSFVHGVLLKLLLTLTITG